MLNRLLALFVGSVVLAACAAPAVAQAPFAPLDQPGPALTPTPAQLKASLSCQPGVTDAKVEPVLLSPGTSTTPTENFGWNWEPALDKLGIPWCAYTAPNQTLDRIDVSGEYLVYAIRTMYKLAGRQIAIIGHSQGGMSMRWAFRFWPDTRTMVADVVGLEPSNHGTTVLTTAACETLGCVPADWQQVSTSNFIEALNSSAETFPGIAYTDLYSTHDELATPIAGPTTAPAAYRPAADRSPTSSSSRSARATSVSTCSPGLPTRSPTRWGSTRSRTGDRPTPARIPKSVCSQVLMPGVLSAQSLAGGLAALGGATGSLGILPGPAATAVSGAPVLHSEPTPPCYVFATCPPSGTLAVTVSPTRATVHHRVRLRIVVTVDVGGVVLPVPGANIWVGNGRHLYTDTTGHAFITIAYGKGGRRRVIATDPEYHDGLAIVRVSRSGA